MTGNGSLDSKEIVLNKDEISSVEKCGYGSRPYDGLTLIIMKNGSKFYMSLDINKLKELNEDEWKLK